MTRGAYVDGQKQEHVCLPSLYYHIEWSGSENSTRRPTWEACRRKPVNKCCTRLLAVLPLLSSTMATSYVVWCRHCTPTATVLVFTLPCGHASHTRHTGS